jgi:hypothetical protein
LQTTPQQPNNPAFSFLFLFSRDELFVQGRAAARVERVVGHRGRRALQSGILARDTS